MSRPWMPLYVADYLRDTRRLTAAEHGAYLLLIMEYWTTGALPDDDRQLSRIACMTPAEWRRARPNVQPFFKDGWKHKRIDAELARSAEISSKRSASAKLKHSKSSALAEQVDTHARASSQPQSQLQPSLRSGKTRAGALGEGWEDFDRVRFWEVFPNKVGKADAMKAFDKATHKTTPDVLFPALHKYANKTDDRPFCNPATWLNQERWLDQPATNHGNRTRNQGSSGHDAILAVAARKARELDRNDAMAGAAGAPGFAFGDGADAAGPGGYRGAAEAGRDDRQGQQFDDQRIREGEIIPPDKNAAGVPGGREFV